MKTKIFLIMFAILSVLLFMAGCDGGGGGPQSAQYSEQQDADWGAVGDAWLGAFKPMSDFSQSTRQTMRDEQRNVRQMERDDRDTLRIINGAQRQQRP